MSQCLAIQPLPPANPGPSREAARFGCQVSRHASIRAQQRALSLELLDIVFTHGNRSPAGGGAEIIRLTLASIYELAVELEPTIWRRHADRLASAYLVVASDGTLVTVGHRIRRFTHR